MTGDLRDRPSDELRQAAATLRERAEAFEGRVWTWTGVGEHGYPQQVHALGNAALIAETYNDPDMIHPAAEWIATVHPAVGLALADVLTYHLGQAEGEYANGPVYKGTLDQYVEDYVPDEVLAVARAINGADQ
jgi:hypothetical protein